MSDREKLAAWMLEHSFATGHGDTIEDLLSELAWQIEELRHRRRRVVLVDSMSSLFDKDYEENLLQHGVIR